MRSLWYSPFPPTPVQDRLCRDRPARPGSCICRGKFTLGPYRALKLKIPRRKVASQDHSTGKFPPPLHELSLRVPSCQKYLSPFRHVMQRRRCAPSIPPAVIFDYAHDDSWVLCAAISQSCCRVAIVHKRRCDGLTDGKARVALSAVSCIIRGGGLSKRLGGK